MRKNYFIFSWKYTYTNSLSLRKLYERKRPLQKITNFTKNSMVNLILIKVSNVTTKS